MNDSIGSTDLSLSSPIFFNLYSETNFNKPFQRKKTGDKLLLQSSLENFVEESEDKVAIFKFSMNSFVFILKRALSMPIGRL